MGTTDPEPRRAAVLGMAALLATALFATGCGDAGQGPETTVRDSAGVAIIGNALPAADAAVLPWRVAPEPSLEIGAADGPEAYQLFRVRAVTRLADGSIAVVNGGTNELRVYGPDGAFRGAAGGKGDGPGEFRAIRLAGHLAADTLLLFDGRHNRFTVATPGPAVARSFTVGPGAGEGAVDALGVLGDGRIAVNGPTQFGDVADASVIMPPRALLVLDHDGALVTPLDTLATRPIYFENNGGFSLTFLPFTIAPQFAVGDSTVYVGDGDAYAIRAYDPRTGRVTRRIRLDRPTRPVTDEMLAEYVEWSVAQADPARAPALRESYEAMPIPETMPAYERLLVDGTGDLWVADFRAPGDEARRWTVFDPTGRVLGTVRTPDDVYIHEIGPDWILGVRRDELDIPYVVMYRLER